MQPVVFRARLTSPLPLGGSREKLTIYASANDLYDLEPLIRSQVRSIDHQEVIQLQFGVFRIFRRLEVNSSCLTLHTEGESRSSLLTLTNFDEEGLSYGAVLETEHLNTHSRWLYGEVERQPLLLRRYAISEQPRGGRCRSQTKAFQKEARELREKVRLLAPK